MSGFEVAGIVLGAVPVAIEFFGAVRSIYKSQIDEEVRRLIVELNQLRVVYQTQLEEVISVLCQTRPDLQALIAGTTPSSAFDGNLRTLTAILQDQTVQQQIHEWLGHSRSSAFNENINEFLICLASTVWEFRKLLPSTMVSSLHSVHD